MEKIDHIAIVVNNINRGVDWYTKNRDCKVKYQDSSWALLEFENIRDQQDVDEFNQSYGVNLTIPQEG